MTWIRAAYGAAAMALALTVGSLAGHRLLGPLLCTVVAVLLLRPWRRRALLGLTGGPGTFFLGLGVTAGSAAVVLGLGTAAGLLTWGPFHPGDVVVYLLINAVIAILLEAFPEELALRGHAYGTLRERHRPWLAAVGTTVLFLLFPGLASVFQAVLGPLVGVDTPPPGIAPPGEDPASYLILLTVFGLTLIAARAAGSLWTSIGAHLTFLSVNRLTLYGEERDSGWSADLRTPDAILLVPAYLLLAALVFVLLRRRAVRARAAAPA